MINFFIYLGRPDQNTLKRKSMHLLGKLKIELILSAIKFLYPLYPTRAVLVGLFVLNFEKIPNSN